MDEHAGNGDRGGHGGGYSDRDWSGSVPRSRAAEAYEESWTDQKLRERYGRRPRPYDRAEGEPTSAAPWGAGAPQSWRPVSAEPARPGYRRRWGGEDASGEVPAVGELLDAGPDRAGWTAVRTDGRYLAAGFATSYQSGPTSGAPRAGAGGGESRRGGRQAARHRDDDSGELRSPDRWMVAGRDQPGYGGSPDHHRPALPAASSEPSWSERWSENERWNEDGRWSEDGRWNESEDRNESWNGGWDEPRERRGHRYQPDFALSDERWR